MGMAIKINNQDIFGMIEKIQQLLLENKVVILDGAFKDTPRWDSFIYLIDFLSAEDYSGTEIRKRKLGLNNDLYLRVADAVDIESQNSTNNLMPELNKVVSYFNTLFKEKTKYSECYLNLTKHCEFKEPHNDQWTAVSWNCQGIVEWRIYKNENNEEYDTFILNPGDVIIVPKYIRHSVIPLTPRASISLAYNMDNNIESYS
jgi:hypothetical protein